MIFAKISRLFTSKQPALIPGPTIKLGSTVYTIAPLNFATLKQMTPLLDSFKALGKTPTTQQYDDMIKVIWLALRRNHPRITLKEVENGLDLQNIHSITTTAMGAGGVTEKGEDLADSQLVK